MPSPESRNHGFCLYIRSNRRPFCRNLDDRTAAKSADTAGPAYSLRGQGPDMAMENLVPPCSPITERNDRTLWQLETVPYAKHLMTRDSKWSLSMIFHQLLGLTVSKIFINCASVSDDVTIDRNYIISHQLWFQFDCDHLFQTNDHFFGLTQFFF